MGAGARGGGDPARMEAGTLGGKRNKSHIWNSNQNARQGGGGNVRCGGVNLTNDAPARIDPHTRFTPVREHSARCKYLDSPGDSNGRRHASPCVRMQPRVWGSIMTVIWVVEWEKIKIKKPLHRGECEQFRLIDYLDYYYFLTSWVYRRWFYLQITLKKEEWEYGENDQVKIEH